jgi:hypothetical protein
MKTAFVLSGGGNLGAIQAGMLKGLWEAEIRPDLVIGTSVGAINAAWVGSHGRDADIEELCNLWRSIRRADVFPSPSLLRLTGYIGGGHTVSPKGQQRILSLAIRRSQRRNRWCKVSQELREGTGRDCFFQGHRPTTEDRQPQLFCLGLDPVEQRCFARAGSPESTHSLP